VINRQVISTSSSVRIVPQESQQPLLAWIVILLFVLFTTVCISIGAGSILRPAYIVLSFAIAIFLYLRYPTFYIGFTWWIWFLTPLISRLIDYRSTFDESRLILLSQYLVALVPLHTLLKDLPKSYRQGGLPFILAFMGVFYGFMIGLVKTSPMTAGRSVLDWLIPIPFGFYLFVNWRNYPQYRQSIERTFLWGVLVMGAYGVVQYLVAPEWDRFWLISTKLTSFGDPEPLALRVWSTQSSPGPFAVTMMTGLLLLLNGKGLLSFAAAGAGYLSFLLTMVRTLWGCWLVGLLTMLTSLKPRLQMRLIITILVMAVCVVPLVTMEPFAGAINARLQTLSNLEKDDSARVRQKIYEDGITKAMTNGLGNGIGNTFVVDKDGILRPIVIDSGFLEMFFTLGWFGAIPYLGGLILLLYQVLQYSEFRFDSFMAASRAIGISCFAALPGGSAMLGLSGMVLWSFLALAMAAHKYYQHQRTTQV
jgi:hypothetical protein